ncbi:alpha/beta hydrolase [Polaribacter sp. BM10]|uniref:alpha/beta fold hydrolase n=1 Tax=Polaribacter sp. BM10 TaxID=1529069 RepID=UPI000989DB9D|nr:alpha/beta fold hydrolase [Polaribacter sp. BM10]AQS94472.1 alpha/beta hydrolase [Polaribacter sp. BM10]
MQDSIQFKKANISFSDTGKGTAIVLLHGFLENAKMWKTITNELSKKNRIITIDLPGHGNSDCLGYVHSMNLFADTIHAVLKHLRIRKYFIIGHSLGGYVALAMAKEKTINVKGICLMNSTTADDSEERKKLRIRANKMVQQNFENMIKMSVSNLFHQENTLKFKEEINQVKTEALQTSLQGYIAANEGMKNRPNSLEFLKESTFKKLMIIGENDRILNADALIEEAKKTNSEYVILPSGHMSHIENTTELIATLKDFVRT